MSVEVVEYINGMYPGKGFDTVSSDIKATPAVQGKFGGIQNVKGQEGEYSFCIVHTSEEFDEALDIGASASYGIPAFKASAKFNFKERCKISSQATFCLISLEAENPFEAFNGDISFTPDAEELLELGKTERFRQRFGNRFISGMSTGGCLYICVCILSESKERQLEIASSIEASYGLFEAKGHFEMDKSSKFSKDELEIFTLQSGGHVEALNSLEEVFSHADQFAKQIRSGLAVPLTVTLEDYNELDLPGDDISLVQQNHARTVMKKMGKSYSQLIEMQNDIDFVLRNQRFYKSFDVKKLNQVNQKLSDAIDELVEKSDACARDLSQCELFTPKIPDFELPKRKKQTASSTTRKPTSSRQSKIRRLKKQSQALKALAAKATNPKRKKSLLAESRKLDRRIKTLRAKGKNANSQKDNSKRTNPKKRAANTTTPKKTNAK